VVEKNKISSILLFVVISASAFLYSCKSNNNNKEITKQPIASVLDKKLYLEDIQSIIPINSTAEDSITIIESYINNWIRENLLLAKAELNLTAEMKNFEKQLEEYRKSLIIYTYERELINQTLDTIVSDEAINEYYEKNKSNFELKETIVKAIFIKLNKKAPQLDKFRKLLKQSDEDSQDKLRAYCVQHAENYHLDTTTWFLLNDLLQLLPVEIYDVEKFLKQNKTTELEDDNYFYFIKTENYKIKNHISPLSFVTDDIKNIIINQRKLQLIAQIRNELYENALEKKQFEIYFNRNINENK
jgi:hypothetical protein